MFGMDDIQKFKVDYVKKNENGKDYIIGDIHGEYDRLQLILDALNFDFDKDRLFSVGDVTDRGPRSYDTLMLNAQQWFYQIKGNHDDMLYHSIMSSYQPDFHMMNVYNLWIARHSEEEHLNMLDILGGLPDILVLETPNGRLNMVHSTVHANFMSGQVTTDETIDWMNGKTIAQINDRFGFRKFNSYLDIMLFSRTGVNTYRDVVERLKNGENVENDLMDLVKPDVDGLSNTFAGHTIDHSGTIHKIKGIYHLDLGLHANKRTGVYSVSNDTFYVAEVDQVAKLTPVQPCSTTNFYAQDQAEDPIEAP